MKKISCIFKLFSIAVIFLAANSYAISSYKIEKGDSLWRISSVAKMKGVTHKQMINAIKGINLNRMPSIIDNVIKTNQILEVPTTEDEIKEGLVKYYADISPRNISKKKNAPAKTLPDAKKTNESKKNSHKDQHASKALSPPQDIIESGEPPQTITINNDNTAQQKIGKAQNEKINLDSINKTTKTTPSDIGKNIILILLIIFIIIMAVRIRRRNYVSLDKKERTRPKKNHPSILYEADNMDHQPLRPTDIRENNSQDNESQDEEEDHQQITNEEIIMEANSYIHYGEIDNAKFLLEESIKRGYENSDIHFKLLEVYIIEKDMDQFNKERGYLLNIVSNDDIRWKDIDKLYQQHLSEF